MSELERIVGSNICFDCKKACGGCPWTEIDPHTGRPRFEPVPGWTAEKAVIPCTYGYYRNKSTGGIQTYHITACPLFEKDDERKGGNNCELDLNELRWLLSRWRKEDV